ncbi:MAG: SufD family Fe-S cluster assembly protein [Pelolinea sp.]|nr:SufD family Fe-S cluster assembly protein [Pelolinea sp.]
MGKKKELDALDNQDLITGLVDPRSFSVSNKKNDLFRKKANEKFISANPKGLIDIFGKKHKDFLSGVESLSLSGSPLINPSVHTTDQKEKVAGKTVIGKLKISNTKICYWLDPVIQAKGVILCDLISALRDHPGIINQFFTKTGINRNTILSNLIIAQAKFGSFLYVPENIQLEGVFIIEINIEPIPNSLLLMHLVTLFEKSSAGNLIIDIRSKNYGFSKSFLVIQNDVFLGEKSKLTFLENQKFNNDSALFISEQIWEGKNVILNNCILDQGSAVLDRFLAIETEAEGSEAKITALYNPKNNQRYFYDTQQNHNTSFTISDLLFKGVLGKDTYSIWKGNIFVARETFGANGYQANNILLIDESAKAESIPGLEILSDDVRCSHGVTMGNIDKDQMFYLQCRGINKKDAEKLIVDGFLLSAVKRIVDKDFEKYIKASLDN